MANDLFYKSGSFNLICDVCGKKVKADEAKHRWDGLIVCKDDWELRHPLDFIKARVDKITVPYSRPRPPDVFVDVCNQATSSGYAGLASAGCSHAGLTYGMSYEDLLSYTYCTLVNRQGIANTAVANCAVAQ